MFSLGLARLAQKHSPEELALVVIGLNPAWIWLVFAVIYTYFTPSTAPAGFYDPSGESRVLLPVIGIAGIGLGVLATLLSLGLIKRSEWRGPILAEGMLVEATPSRWSLGRRGQIIIRLRLAPIAMGTFRYT